MNLGVPELLLILAVLLLLFGARKLPDLARSLGKSSKAFKEGLKDGADEEPAGQDAPKPEGSKAE